MTAKVLPGALQAMVAAVREGASRVAAGALAGSSSSLLAARLAVELGRPALLITPEDAEAAKAADEIGFYLAALGSRARAWLLPPRELSSVVPGQDPSLRRRALAEALVAGRERPTVVAASIGAVLARAPAPDDFHDLLFELHPGLPLDRDRFLAALIGGGYGAAAQVMEPGDFSSRGGILDVFPPGADDPVRLEFWGDEVKSIRSFDPSDQKSRVERKSVLVPPFSEVLINAASAARAASRVSAWMSRIKEGRLPGVGGGDVLRDFGAILGRIERQDHFPGVAAFLPAFHPDEFCALDYLDRDWVVVLHEPFLCDQAFARLLAELEAHFVDRLQKGEFLLAPADHFVSRGHAERGLEALALIAAGPAHGEADAPAAELAAPGAPRPRLSGAPLLPALIEDLSRLKVDPEQEAPLGPFLAALADFQAWGVRTVIVSPLAGKAERFKELLEGHGVAAPLLPEPAGALGGTGAVITVGAVTRGLIDLGGKLAVIPEAELFGEKIRATRKPRALEAFLSDLSDLDEGDYVVHVDHGVGRYRGLTSLEVQWIGEWDFVNLRERPRIRVDSARIEYRDSATLFVPVHRINQISKYAGPTEVPPPLDALGGTAWDRLKKKAKRSIQDFAEQLVRIHARRKVLSGVAFPPPDQSYLEFEESFDYEETPDQLRAIEDVLEDMRRPAPMDRVVCGDVGYGKTEVALRAAFLAAMSGRQVAVLVPTTILAQQHYETFVKRLKKYPLEVRVLSRFLSAKAQKAVVAEIKSGVVDLVVGTHRLLSKDVVWNDLGLLVIDEEHRFGVRHKERVRELATIVDTLTLTATPIPRTLYMALSGLRDLSVIDTPPPDRLSVHTELCRSDDRVIQEAIERELRRGGQVFFVHNRVQTIEAVAAKVKSLVPAARVSVGHGQMDEHELERVMRRFVARETDVLCCTAIIESGLDIPTANTMVIDRADHFGLAQLYQLRGRIGRSKLRGYCYLLIPTKAALTPDAAKRLRALKEFTELGSGFRIAAHDLEIRGAGNVLGAEQSGHVHRIGLELYMQLLEEEIAKQKGEPREAELEPEIKLPIASYLPDDYVPAEKERLGWYKRLARARHDPELDALRDELRDRYGPPPEPATNLIEVARIKARLARLGALELAYTGTELALALADDTRADVERVLKLATQKPNLWRLTPDGRVFKKISARSPADLFPAIAALLNEVSGGDIIST